MTEYKRYLLILIYSVFALTGCSNIYATTVKDDPNIQTIIHLLDYLSKDYPGAVKNGSIIDEGEYLEMLEFSETIFSLSQKLELTKNQADQILTALKDLQVSVLNKVSHKKIKAIASKAKWYFIKFTDFEITPANWPDLKNGQKLFLNNCVQCHGTNGNGKGKLAVGLNPVPTNFLDDTVMGDLSPFQAYNTIKLGVEGTAMQSFSMLNDKEVWDLSFYIKSLRFERESIDSTSINQLFDQANNKVALKDVAILSDRELLAHLSKSTDVDAQLKALRTYSPTTDDLPQNTLDKAINYLKNARQNYVDGQNEAARDDALAAYLEGIEPSEARLKANAPAFTSGLEQQMLKVRQSIEQKKDFSDVDKEINTALSMITRAKEMMKDEKLNYWLSFFLSASIMLREGLEAFLILALILALVRSSGVKNALPWIHGGWLAAIVLGIAGWFFSDWVISVSGKNREIMEGLISLIAVIVLAFVGFWLHDHSHAKKWKVFIEEKIGKQLEGEKMFGLAFFSFMVVFREAFESVLFLQAISLETKSGNQSAIGLGVLAAFGLIVLFAFLFLKFSKKIPVRQLFRYSAWVITLLALILMGKGIHSIQEAGWFSITGFPVSVSVDWLGIYPTVETIIAQIVLLGLMLLLYFWSNLKSRVQLS